MQHAFERDVGDEVAMARDEAAVLAHAAIGGDEAEGCGIGAHFASTVVSFAASSTPSPERRVRHARADAATRRIGLAQRSAANCTASMIWP